MGFLQILRGLIGSKNKKREQVIDSIQKDNDTTKDQYHTVIFNKLNDSSNNEENATIVFKTKLQEMPILEILEGKDAGKKYTLEGKFITLGRRDDNQVIIHDPNVSRYHARILYKENWEIEDLESTNGIFVNGEKVIKRPLKSDDEILIGSTLVKFRLK